MLKKPEKKRLRSSKTRKVKPISFGCSVDDAARLKVWRESVGLTQSNAIHKLLRHGEAWAAAWHFHETGYLNPVPELAGELREILDAELRLRMRLGELARKVADATAPDQGAREEFEEQLRREGRGGYVRKDRRNGKQESGNL